MRGIILVGGTGSRLFPITKAVSKQLMPVYDKPMVYYPLSTLMQAGIREVLFISTPGEQHLFERLFGDGSDLGMSFSYASQPSPDGLAQALIIGEDFIGDEKVVLILGDNLFYGIGLDGALSRHRDIDGAMIFAYRVSNPQDYGIVTFDADGTVVDLQEKPVSPASNYAVPGIYFYDNDVVAIAKTMTPSARGELEITDVNREYMSRGKLHVDVLERGTAWLDTGTIDSMVQATEFIRAVSERQGTAIGCIEEIAWRSGWIDDSQLLALARPMEKSSYGKYLLGLLPGERT